MGESKKFRWKDKKSGNLKCRGTVISQDISYLYPHGARYPWGFRHYSRVIKYSVYDGVRFLWALITRVNSGCNITVTSPGLTCFRASLGVLLVFLPPSPSPRNFGFSLFNPAAGLLFLQMTGIAYIHIFSIFWVELYPNTMIYSFFFLETRLIRALSFVNSEHQGIILRKLISRKL